MPVIEFFALGGKRYNKQSLLALSDKEFNEIFQEVDRMKKEVIRDIAQPGKFDEFEYLDNVVDQLKDARNIRMKSKTDKKIEEAKKSIRKMTEDAKGVLNEEGEKALKSITKMQTAYETVDGELSKRIEELRTDKQNELDKIIKEYEALSERQQSRREIFEKYSKTDKIANGLDGRLKKLGKEYENNVEVISKDIGELDNASLAPISEKKGIFSKFFDFIKSKVSSKKEVTPKKPNLALFSKISLANKKSEEKKKTSGPRGIQKVKAFLMAGLASLSFTTGVAAQIYENNDMPTTSSESYEMSFDQLGKYGNINGRDGDFSFAYDPNGVLKEEFEVSGTIDYGKILEEKFKDELKVYDPRVIPGFESMTPEQQWEIMNQIEENNRQDSMRIVVVGEERPATQEELEDSEEIPVEEAKDESIKNGTYWKDWGEDINPKGSKEETKRKAKESEAKARSEMEEYAEEKNEAQKVKMDEIQETEDDKLEHKATPEEIREAEENSIETVVDTVIEDIIDEEEPTKTIESLETKGFNIKAIEKIFHIGMDAIKGSKELKEFSQHEKEEKQTTKEENTVKTPEKQKVENSEKTESAIDRLISYNKMLEDLSHMDPRGDMSSAIKSNFSKVFDSKEMQKLFEGNPSRDVLLKRVREALLEKELSNVGGTLEKYDLSVDDGSTSSSTTVNNSQNRESLRSDLQMYFNNGTLTAELCKSLVHSYFNVGPEVDSILDEMIMNYEGQPVEDPGDISWICDEILGGYQDLNGQENLQNGENSVPTYDTSNLDDKNMASINTLQSLLNSNPSFSGAMSIASEQIFSNYGTAVGYEFNEVCNKYVNSLKDEGEMVAWTKNEAKPYIMAEVTQILLEYQQRGEENNKVYDSIYEALKVNLPSSEAGYQAKQNVQISRIQTIPEFQKLSEGGFLDLKQVEAAINSGKSPKEIYEMYEKANYKYEIVQEQGNSEGFDYIETGLKNNDSNFWNKLAEKEPCLKMWADIGGFNPQEILDSNLPVEEKIKIFQSAYKSAKDNLEKLGFETGENNKENINDKEDIDDER